MAHLDPLARESLSDLSGVLAMAEERMGFVPNSLLTMAHMPQLTMAFSMLVGVVFGADLKTLMAAHRDAVPTDAHADEALPADLVQLIAYAVSVSAGCRYCQAHTSHQAHGLGLDEAKLSSIVHFETAPEFSDAERAVVGLALAAGEVPNGVNQDHFDALKPYYNDRQVTQMVAVIAVFGFLNRWNDTMATTLESEPIAFAQQMLPDWQVGKHQ